LPWAISANPASGRSGICRPNASLADAATATSVAVSVVRASGEWTISTGGPAGIGRAGAACGLASRAAASAA
jgi:hypothetical protein